MDTKLYVFVIYTTLGLLIIIYNFKIANFVNNLVLYFTNKLKIEELFLFRIDNNNKDLIFKLMRFSTFLLGLFISSFSIYMLYSIIINK